MNKITETSFSSITASMGAISIFSFIKSLNSKTEKKKLSNSIAGLINTIAFIHYFKMRNIWESQNKDIVAIRYSDWFITCPLLLFEYFILREWIVVEDNEIKIADKLKFPLYSSIVLCILMLVFGYISDTNPKKRNLFFGLGCICLVLIFIIIAYVEIKRPNNDKPIYPMFFIGIWAFYGIVNMLPKYRDLFYNILDFIAKVMFAFMIQLSNS